MNHPILLWGGFGLFVAVMLLLDLGVFHRETHEVGFKEALIWTGVWVALALLFNVGIFVFMDHRRGLEFLAGYLLEESLSIDNIFVFLLIFNFFRVPPAYQHKVLFWGILGALVLRLLFIVAGVALIKRIEWMIPAFGVFLIYTGIKMAFHKDEEVNPENNFVLRIFKRFVPLTPDYEGMKFFVRNGGRLMATPLFVVLLLIETTDVLFAIDSIPAVLAISKHPFIIYTSNIFAIMGLRSLYFALAGVMDLFHFLHYGLSAVLTFIGIKMVIEHHYEIPIYASLLFIAVAISVAIWASIHWPVKHPPIEKEAV